MSNVLAAVNSVQPMRYQFKPVSPPPDVNMFEWLRNRNIFGYVYAKAHDWEEARVNGEGYASRSR